MPILGCLCGSISIHAPRMGSDKHFLHACAVVAHISIHAPRMGSDPPIRAKMTTSHIFQSTPPHGERPTWGASSGGSYEFQSTPPAWGATAGVENLQTIKIISIHAPRMGSDIIPIMGTNKEEDFNPRPPHGERHHLHRKIQ